MLNFHQSLSHSPNLSPQTIHWTEPQTFRKPFPKLMEVFTLESDWLAPNHPIPNAKFPPITEPFPKHFPLTLPQTNLQTIPQTIHSTDPQPFPKWFPKLMEISTLESYLLAPNQRMPNAKFPPITALLNRSTYHKIANGFPTTLSPNHMDTPYQWISLLLMRRQCCSSNIFKNNRFFLLYTNYQRLMQRIKFTWTIHSFYCYYLNYDTLTVNMMFASNLYIFASDYKFHQ